ncbi:hypothetical protein C923_04833 [Plasmodium falciparum UGT5.1]|uniref:Uncharacterized protein n=1 Tax=Plasmodium falciparum UGT5.1 TaxID=1237627 RepID=W7J7I8_PLAFA|nr:hypothetical protein C923_04833 [Plasmodium falciparum UGT5.1]
MENDKPLLPASLFLLIIYFQKNYIHIYYCMYLLYITYILLLLYLSNEQEQMIRIKEETIVNDKYSRNALINYDEKDCIHNKLGSSFLKNYTFYYLKNNNT